MLMKSSVLWDITLVHAGFLLSLFLNLKIEATVSSETSVDSQMTTQRYIRRSAYLNIKKHLFSPTRMIKS
jgi:hypothetical protein